MTIALVILGLALAAEFFSRSRAERSWAKERQLLLERIQHPERVSVAEPGPIREPLETDAPAMALIGTIDYGEPGEAA
jgi:hypothetical protein